MATDLIAASEVTRHIRALAADSMMSRDTTGITRMAHYVAEQFRELGLRPSGDGDFERGGIGNDTSTSWFQRYPLPGHRVWDDAGSQLTLATPLGKGMPDIVDEGGMRIDKRVVLHFGTDAQLAADTVPESGAAPLKGERELASPVAVVAGPHTAASVRQAAIRNKLVFYVPSIGTAAAVQHQVIVDLAGANKVIVVGAEDSAAASRPVVVVSQYMEDVLNVRGWAVRVRLDAVAELLAIAGLDIARLRAAGAAVIHEMPAMKVELRPAFKATATGTAMGANVVGILEGRGPKFGTEPYEPWAEYVVFVAHMDSMANPRGTTNVAGLLALAKAFSQPTARPRRSLLFIASGGGVDDVRGSNYFVHRIEQFWRPIRMDRIAAALAFDLRGHLADSVWVAGLRDLEFTKRPEWGIAEYPERGFSVVDDERSADPGAGHVAFARKAVPSLYVNGSREGAALADVEHAARILRVVFRLGYDIADTEVRPRWSTAGRRNRLARFGE